MKTHLILLALATSLSAEPIQVYLGTNTGGRSKSEGIYSTTFDPDNGSFGPVELAGRYLQPGFLALHPTKPILYSTGSPSVRYEDGTSSVAAFQIEKGGKLTFLKDASTGGTNACHLAVDGTGRTVAVANYGDGKISTIRLDAAGKPEGSVSILTHSGSGPNKARQDRPHAHGVYFDKTNQFLFVPDLGLDRIWTCQFNAGGSEINAREDLSQSTTPGAGPRHLALSADEKFGYVVNELDNTVTVSTISKGTFKAIQSIPTLPADWKGDSTTAEIEVHPNGKFVYASNRGHDSIAVYARDGETGKLTLVEITPCGGKNPRHFKIAPGGKWLLCAHQDSNTVVALPLDPATGKLGAPNGKIDCPTPICVQFVPGQK